MDCVWLEDALGVPFALEARYSLMPPQCLERDGRSAGQWEGDFDYPAELARLEPPARYRVLLQAGDDAGEGGEEVCEAALADVASVEVVEGVGPRSRRLERVVCKVLGRHDAVF